ncbi:MAG: Radical SAM protein [Cenarchaeum symbiont of Oopsacas minuta]|nr:Radical SAM protein [Cenarchaeum symbiont of Oopsacas minuta]
MPESNIPISVNFHLIKTCNEQCGYCFATFDDRRFQKQLELDQVKQILTQLHMAGTEKITFVGGEPTLFKDLDNAIIHAKQLGMITCLVTNGARLERLLEGCDKHLNWVAFSIDSIHEDIQQKLGRGKGDYIKKSIRLAKICHKLGIKVKLNTVITDLNYTEDFSWLIKTIRPKRWKVFQALPIKGQNDGKIEKLLISSEKFQTFCTNNKHLENNKLKIIFEDNDAMTESYIMIDPDGKFFSNVDGKYVYSSPILKVGVSKAFSEIRFNIDKFEKRNGKYNW